MFYSLGAIFRRADISAGEFRDHYESQHTQLAYDTLPHFSHYVRNHRVKSAGPMACPDSLSEFGLDAAEKFQQIFAILNDERGRPLLADELTFMDKARNQAFAVQRKSWGETAAAHKYLLWFEGDADFQVRLERLRAVDPALKGAVLCTPDAGAPPQALSCWLCWSTASTPPARLLEKFEQHGETVLCCAQVDEVIGYPRDTWR